MCTGAKQFKFYCPFQYKIFFVNNDRFCSGKKNGQKKKYNEIFIWSVQNVIKECILTSFHQGRKAQIFDPFSFRHQQCSCDTKVQLPKFRIWNVERADHLNQSNGMLDLELFIYIYFVRLINNNIVGVLVHSWISIENVLIRLSVIEKM